MQKYKVTVADKALEEIRGKPLIQISNADGELYLGFGEMIQWDKHKAPQYVLKIATQFRFTLDTEIILGKQDLFWPSYEESHKKGFKMDEFNPNSKKQSRFNEQIERFFNADVIGDYIVKDVRAGKMGDFLLIFKNGARLEVVSDAFDLPTIDDNYELWRLFETNKNKSDFVVKPLGIAETDEEWGFESHE
ncbi:MAG: hypothetical protein LBL34_06510 [Clostridiales bacterium]|jgi:hypothetical protein|nr:hypothetical protein [Clostridiales bacterium]